MRQKMLIPTVRTIFFVMTSFIFLSGCAAIQGAQGDHADKAALEAQSQNAGKTINTQTITSPTPPNTTEQNAVNNAAKMLSPLH